MQWDNLKIKINIIKNTIQYKVTDLTIIFPTTEMCNFNLLQRIA